MFRLSAAGIARLGPLLSRFGYNVARARFSFADGLGAAGEADGDFIRLDQGRWGQSSELEQRRVLTHELAHSAQFQKLGYTNARFRFAWEKITRPFSVYDVADDLANMSLGQINIVDPRFTLESIAVRVYDFAGLPSAVP
jgi:hypothetical protein